MEGVALGGKLNLVDCALDLRTSHRKIGWIVGETGAFMFLKISPTREGVK